MLSIRLIRPFLLASTLGVVSPGALAQQYDGTPGNVIAMNTMECVTYYTAFSEILTPHEYEARETILERASTIITDSTPENDEAVYLERAEKAASDAVHIVTRFDDGIVSRADIAGLVSACDTSFGYEPLSSSESDG